jgi:hypothetical protein
MSAEFTVTIDSEEMRVRIEDDLSVQTDSVAITELLEIALEFRPNPGYEPHPLAGVAKYLVEKFDGKDLTIVPPAYLNDPTGVVY